MADNRAVRPAKNTRWFLKASSLTPLPSFYERYDAIDLRRCPGCHTVDNWKNMKAECDECIANGEYTGICKSCVNAGRGFSVKCVCSTRCEGVKKCKSPYITCLDCFQRETRGDAYIEELEKARETYENDLSLHPLHESLRTDPSAIRCWSCQKVYVPRPDSKDVTTCDLCEEASFCDTCVLFNRGIQSRCMHDRECCTSTYRSKERENECKKTKMCDACNPVLKFNQKRKRECETRTSSSVNENADAKKQK